MPTPMPSWVAGMKKAATASNQFVRSASMKNTIWPVSRASSRYRLVVTTQRMFVEFCPRGPTSGVTRNARSLLPRLTHECFPIQQSLPPYLSAVTTTEEKVEVVEAFINK
jgi:hypothetical protein